MSDGHDVINGIEPTLFNLANLLDLLVDQTSELNSGHPEGRGPADRVHALAGACVSTLGELIATAYRLADLNQPGGGDPFKGNQPESQ